jgi:hypothetical protein
MRREEERLVFTGASNGLYLEPINLTDNLKPKFFKIHFNITLLIAVMSSEWFERAKTVHALDRVTTVIGMVIINFLHILFRHISGIEINLKMLIGETCTFLSHPPTLYFV